MYDKYFTTKKPGSPIRKLMAPACVGTQRTSVTEARHRDTPRHYYNIIILGDSNFCVSILFYIHNYIFKQLD